MKSRVFAVALVAVAGRAVEAQVTVYNDEAQFLNALAVAGFVPIQEGFEDDAAWGTVRSTVPDGQHTAPSLSNLGITWSSASVNNEFTTGPGPARTGSWGFYSLPHGDYANGLGDGWRGTATQSTIVAIGGWIETNTPPAKLGLFLDGVAVDWNGNDVLSSQHAFFGVIAPQGFGQFEFRELEGVLLDQKFIFADDFTFALSGELADCNANGIADGQDVLNGTSADCNRNFLPDECEIAESSSAPGGPYYCTANCASDCNNNGVLDSCEVVTEQAYSSGTLSPIGAGSPQNFQVVDPPVAVGNVLLNFTAYANLGGGPDALAIAINGNAIGQVFGPDGSDCPETEPDSSHLIVAAEDFNSFVNGGDALISIVAGPEVNPTECALPTYVTVEVVIPVSSDADLNADGVLDVCEGQNIPAVGEWGLVVLVLLITTAGSILSTSRHPET